MNKEIELARYYNKETEKVIRVTVSKYHSLIEEKNKVDLANFIYHRLHSRYINPFDFDDSDYKEQYKNGFSMMASYCLLIETLQSFKKGWGDSDRKSGQLFEEFFKNNNNFEDLENKGREIYKHIRCGILHQGESTGGWTITREKKELLKHKIIDSVIFGEILEKSLKEYQTLLTIEAWDSEIWDNFRTKMRRIIANTQR